MYDEVGLNALNILQKIDGAEKEAREQWDRIISYITRHIPLQYEYRIERAARSAMLSAICDGYNVSDAAEKAFAPILEMMDWLRSQKIESAA